MRLTLLAPAAIAAMTFPASAQEAKPAPTPCYEIAVLPDNPQSIGVALMVNKCTGETWYLARTADFDKQGHATHYGYTWNSIPSH
jgi:hypothetical protein